MQAPVNYHEIDATPEKIEADAAYALALLDSYVNSLPGGVKFLKGKTVLEIGPGINLGAMLAIKALGAKKAFVADRFLCQYQESYHGLLYLKVKHLLLAKYPSAQGSVFDLCIRTNRHDEDLITCQECALEELAKQYPARFDITLSHAVFEHLYDPLEAFRSLHRLTAEGGLGYHQVDFRDHRDFSRPLEYLCCDEFSFNKLLHSGHAECGNRVRPHEMQGMFVLAGFQPVEFHPNMWAEADYLQEFIPRLRAATITPYSQLGADFLRPISGQFMLVKRTSKTRLRLWLGRLARKVIA